MTSTDDDTTYLHNHASGYLEIILVWSEGLPMRTREHGAKSEEGVAHEVLLLVSTVPNGC